MTSRARFQNNRIRAMLEKCTGESPNDHKNEPPEETQSQQRFFQYSETAEQGDMTRGRELPVNSKVRRRLFQDDPPEPSEWKPYVNHDQHSTVIKTEYIARTIDNHLILQGMKWNFNFHTERALRGCLQWYRKGNSDKWVMMEPTGRSVRMPKRSREPMSGLKFTHQEERRAGRKKRRLSPHTVELRRGFFTDGRVQNMAVAQAKDENFNNELNGNPLPRLVKSIKGAFIVQGFDTWDTEEEREDDEKPTGYQGYERKDELKQNQEKHDVPPNETSKNNKHYNGIGTIAGVETLDEVATIGDVGTINGLADHLSQAGPNPPKMHDYFPDIIEVDKDDNDNEKPLISENQFKKLRIDDKDSDEKEQNTETENDMNNYIMEQDDVRDNEEELLDMKDYEKEQNVLVNYDVKQNDMKTNEEDQNDMENNEEQIEMKYNNETTPRNEKKKEIAQQKKGKAKAGNGKAKMQLHNSRY